MLGRHGRLEEGQQPTDGGEVHPAVVHDGVALVGEVVGLTVPTYRHVLVHAAGLDGVLVDPDVPVPVRPVLGVDEAEDVEQLVHDERLPPCAQPATEGKVELEADTHRALVLRTLEVSGAEGRGPHLSSVLERTEEAEVVTVNTVIASGGRQPQLLEPRPTSVYKLDASVVLYLCHDLTYDPPVLLDDRPVKP